MPAPLLIPAALAISRVLAKKAIPHFKNQWIKAIKGKDNLGKYAKTAKRVSVPAIGAGVAMEAVEDYADTPIPEILPNTIIGAGLYHQGKKKYASAEKGLANYFNPE
jgi:hypothetical protein|tara:strand:+ start:161 stop:481 length:321 start_codon:yes stop_codon:yes gene_type:complete